MADSIRFVLNGKTYVITRADVLAAVERAQPEPVRTLSVEIAGRVFPVKQAFALATGVERSEFISHTAYRHLADLGFRVHRRSG